MSLDDRRRAVTDQHRSSEQDVMAALVARPPFNRVQGERITANAIRLVEGCRARRSERSNLDLFLQEFGLSNEEGIALLCLAEALLRIPDDRTAEELIADKLSGGRWDEHLGHSESTFVNASVWALMLTGHVLRLNDDITARPVQWLASFTTQVGENVARAAMVGALKILSQEFVVGSTIESALKRSRTLCSFDMLGEGARSMTAADAYFESYEHALNTVVAAAGTSNNPQAASGVSIKLSALDPRFEPLQADACIERLLPRVEFLARIAAGGNVGLTIDAEESWRTEIGLTLFEALARCPALQGWDGLGLAVQAYAKRAPAIIDWLATLAEATNRRFMVRLVKGAYWDTEIKRAQVEGLDDYPVFTRKPNTDLAYLACATRLFSYAPHLYPQFATHNAHTMCALAELAGQKSYEYQRLHGMGELLYDEFRRQHPDMARVRVYAPVGAQHRLLGYLVRRLLENGANSSFINRFLDDQVAAAEVVRDPTMLVSRQDAMAHPDLALPRDLYRGEWTNSAGVDLGDPQSVHALRTSTAQWGRASWSYDSGTTVTNPADPDDTVGTTSDIHPDDIDDMIAAARAAFPAWDTLGPEGRSRTLDHLADAIADNRDELIALLQRETGKTLIDGISELREAQDFCRYYAALARTALVPRVLPGPTGETNTLTLHGRGVFACIAPWNFPAAVFTGQLAAALVCGNAVVAKPAPQTPLIAHRLLDLAVDCGIAQPLLQLANGDDNVGEALVAHPDLAGVAFTGSTQAARAIAQTLAAKHGPLVPLIAETGGQNAMIVDSSALIEQVVDDVIASAFLSAGQRCSALRVLYVQREIADQLVDLLIGAMDMLAVGDPRDHATDIGPVIDQSAREQLESHVESRRVLHRTGCPEFGSFVAPTLIELDNAADLHDEHFGPILHLVRYDANGLERIIDEINTLGFGLTFGIHSRIDSVIELCEQRVRVGNRYVNRTMTGAVVGVQPFGGEGLSGTGPKAGGPNYLQRFVTERVVSRNTVATGGNPDLLNLPA